MPKVYMSQAWSLVHMSQDSSVVVDFVKWMGLVGSFVVCYSACFSW